MSHLGFYVKRFNYFSIMRSLVIILAASLFFQNCSAPEEFKFDELTIVTTDAAKLSNWYARNLDFMESKDFSLLYHDNLTIKLQENKDAKSRQSVADSYNLSYLPGIFKFGFITNQFDDLIAHLRKNNVAFQGGILTDSTLNRRMVIIKDPDANYIQLFEDNGPDKLKPFFLGLVAEQIGEQEKWYQMHLPVTNTHNLDMKKQDVFIRLMTGKEVITELINVEKSSISAELDRANISGYYSISMNGAPIAFESDGEGNLISNTPKH